MAKKYAALIISLCTFADYVALSAKQYTWMFVSGDSGDWLASANAWIVPQPYGSPLYISLCRLLGLMPNQPTTLTIVLSCLPSAITVGLVYLIVRKLTSRVWCALTASLVLLGMGVFLTQSTILEEYVLTIMFLTLAYFFYIGDRRKLTALCLGLGTAVHIFILPITVFWFVLEYKQLRLKFLAVYFLSGALTYLLIPLLMYFGDGLTFSGLWQYWAGTSGAIVGTLSIFDAPQRLLSIAQILLMSLGLAVIPLWYGLKKPYDTKKVVLVMIVLVSLWYHLTCLDPISWTFLCFGIPAITVLCGLGLSKLSLKHTCAVAACALVLIIVNGVFLNANILTNEEPLAVTYYQELYSLPNGSAIVAAPGSYSFGLLYVISEGKKLCPIEVEDAVVGDYFAGPRNRCPATLSLDTGCPPRDRMVYRIISGLESESSFEAEMGDY